MPHIFWRCLRRAIGGFAAVALSTLFVAPAVALSAGPTLYVAADKADYDIHQSLRRIDSADKVTVPANLPKEAGICGLTVDRRGNLYAVANDVGATKDAQIIKLTPDGEKSIFASMPGDDALWCRCLVVDSHGNVFVSDGDDIIKLTPDGKRSIFATVFSGEAQTPNGMAFDAHDNLYVAVTASFHDRIVKVTPNGKQRVFAVMPGSTCPQGLATDAHGNLYVASIGHNRAIKVTDGGYIYRELPSRIIKYTRTGKRSVFALMPLHSDVLEGLAFDSRGNLYVANYTGNRITKVSADSSQVTTFATIDAPTFLACSPTLGPAKAAR